MIKKFRKVCNNLYRGSAPNIYDVKDLKKKYNINKIISLDEESGLKIHSVCKELGIEHVIMPISFDNLLPSLINVLNQDFTSLFFKNKPCFVHCLAGKDRTGLICAMIECIYLNKSPEQAIKAAKGLGFGYGIKPRHINMFEIIIKNCHKLSHDQNISKDSIVDIERENSLSNFDNDNVLNIDKKYPYNSLYKDLKDNDIVTNESSYQTEGIPFTRFMDPTQNIRY